MLCIPNILSMRPYISLLFYIILALFLVFYALKTYCCCKYNKIIKDNELSQKDNELSQIDELTYFKLSLLRNFNSYWVSIFATICFFVFIISYSLATKDNSVGKDLPQLDMLSVIDIVFALFTIFITIQINNKAEKISYDSYCMSLIDFNDKIKLRITDDSIKLNEFHSNSYEFDDYLQMANLSNKKEEYAKEKYVCCVLSFEINTLSPNLQLDLSDLSFDLKNASDETTYNVKDNYYFLFTSSTLGKPRINICLFTNDAELKMLFLPELFNLHFLQNVSIEFNIRVSYNQKLFEGSEENFDTPFRNQVKDIKAIYGINLRCLRNVDMIAHNNSYNKNLPPDTDIYRIENVIYQ